MGIEVIGSIVAGALVIVGVMIWLIVRYAKKSAVEEFRRDLEEYAREMSEDVTEVLGQPLGSDAELLARIKPDGVPEDEDRG